MGIIPWLFEALESWGIRRLFGWLGSFFRHTPLKDMEKAHDAENKISGLGDAAVDRELRGKWER